MPSAKRVRREPTDDWQHLRLYVATPEQETYELLRPVVLFGRTPAERAAETGVAERTLRRKADRFAAAGMASLFEAAAPTVDDRRALPPEIHQAILDLRAEHPPLRPNEIATICRHRFDRPVSHHTVQRSLAAGTPPTDKPRRYPRYREIADPVERRLAVVRLCLEGWNIASVAAYLATSRRRVYQVLRRWYDEGLPGLEDHSHAPAHPARKVEIKALAGVRRLQANPRLGEFRVAAALEQQGIVLSPRTCGRIPALHRALGAPKPEAAEPREPRPMPFAATRRHQIWSVDLRSIEEHRLGTGKPLYVISILDNYSRALLASLPSPRQDLPAFLVVLRAALLAHGAPEVLVSDSGGVFLAKQAQAIYRSLGIEKREIDRRQAWQNYIETHFNIMRRMADHGFAQAATWEEFRAVHERFFRDYNGQSHHAHRDRPAGRRGPAAALGWVRGAWCDAADLDRHFRVRAHRRVNAHGFVRFRHWRFYGERGLRGAEAAVWVLGETLTVEHAADTLAQYRVAFAPDGRHIREVAEPRLFPARHPAPQPWLPGMATLEWHPALRLSRYCARLARRADGAQLPLFPPVGTPHEEAEA